MRRKGWSVLPPDLLREIAGLLHVAGDFVCFHAVCKSWRSSSDLLSRKQFLPWLLVPTKSSSPLRLRCVFSKSSYRVLPPPYPRQKNWMCSTDGTTVRYVTVKQLRPTMHDPITGAINDLPCFPSNFQHRWEEENPCGIIHGDGTTFLYALSHGRLQGALLCPGQAEWMLVKGTFGTHFMKRDFCATYHRGRILVTVEFIFCRLVMLDGGDDVLVLRPWLAAQNYLSERCIYILASHGELLWASVHCTWPTPTTPSDTFSVWVTVYALQEATVSEKPRWVEKEGNSLADQVLFLGSPNSFAVDASLLGGQGGCAYFVCNNSETRFPKQLGVFKYNFIDHKTELIERLPEEWDNEKCTWFVPQPTIAPVQEIIKLNLEAQKLKKQQKTAPITSPSRIVHIERHYEHRFRVVVHDLPLNVKNSKLQLFFSKHGKVSSTKIVHHKNNETSQRIGIISMATMHGRQDYAFAALDGLNFDGCKLEVILVKDRKRLRLRKAAA